MTSRQTILCLLLVTCLLHAGCRRADSADESPVSASADASGGHASGGQTLDARFIDRDDDMVADPPADPAQWKDPDVLVFAYTPVEDPAVYRDVWAGFLDHLSSVTGKRVQFFPVQSNAAQLEALRAGRLHITGFNTGGVVTAVNLAGFVPFCVMADDQGRFGYEMELIVPAAGPIQTPADLVGHTIAFTSPTSNSGFKAPSVVLEREFGLRRDEHYTAVFSGKHDNSILGVANGDYEAAAIANEVKQRMIVRGVIREDALRTIYTSAAFPTTGYGYAHDLKPELAEKIKQAFYSFPWEGSALLAEFGRAEKPVTCFHPITYKQHWRIVREIDEALRVAGASK